MATAKKPSKTAKTTKKTPPARERRTAEAVANEATNIYKHLKTCPVGASAFSIAKALGTAPRSIGYALRGLVARGDVRVAGRTRAALYFATK